jgi:hypothetical protein
LRENRLRASRSPLSLTAIVGLRIKIRKLGKSITGVNVEVVRGELACLQWHGLEMAGTSHYEV